MGHHDAAAVDTLPQADGVGIFLVSFVERIFTPSELLRRETDESAVCGEGRQVISKAEAVGQEHVCALFAELLTIEGLADENVAKPRLRRHDDRLVGVPSAAGEVPAAVGNILLHLFKLVGIVLLHP